MHFVHPSAAKGSFPTSLFLLSLAPRLTRNDGGTTQCDRNQAPAIISPAAIDGACHWQTFQGWEIMSRFVAAIAGTSGKGPWLLSQVYSRAPTRPLRPQSFAYLANLWDFLRLGLGFACDSTHLTWLLWALASQVPCSVDANYVPRARWKCIEASHPGPLSNECQQKGKKYLIYQLTLCGKKQPANKYQQRSLSFLWCFCGLEWRRKLGRAGHNRMFIGPINFALTIDCNIAGLASTMACIRAT